MKQRITLVVAAAENGVIGRDNAMPWHLPSDLAHFKLLTWGKPILMGRKTFEAIGKPLPGRQNIVLTRDQGWRREGVVVAHSLDAALAAAAAAPEVMVIGGALLYRECLPLATRLHLTRVHATLDGDTQLPPIDFALWRETARHEHPADARNAHAHSYLTYERI